MPLLKHAIKKMRQDARKRIKNKKINTELKSVIKKASENPSSKNVSGAFSAIDKAVKVNLLHKNTAARKKSSLAAKIKTVSKTSTKPKKPSRKN